jgi:hypothetical protein
VLGLRLGSIVLVAAVGRGGRALVRHVVGSRG